jgi:hypothetical protein
VAAALLVLVLVIGTVAAVHWYNVYATGLLTATSRQHTTDKAGVSPKPKAEQTPPALTTRR